MKVTIKGIIKENKEDLFIDRIVESLLGDTTYEFDTEMGEIICELKSPQNDGKPIYYNESDIKSHLNAFKNMTEWGYAYGTNITNYIDKNYGITDENILGKIYLKYYTILFTNILNDFNDYQRKSMNESVGNREDLLVDKIVKSLLNDTEYRLYHMGEIICKIEWPMLVTDFGYSQYEIERYLNELRKSNDYSWPIGPEDYKYLDRNYGITDETIIRKIYFKYHIILFTNILIDFDKYERKPIDESVGNREDLLVNKISQYMLDDTEYYFHRDRVIIDYPSEGFNSYTIEKVLPLLLKRGYDIDFVNYVQNTYSIKDWNLITNISQRYYSLLYDKVKEMLGSTINPMNESVGNREDLLVDRVVESLIGDTTHEVYREDNPVVLTLVSVKYPMYREPMIFNRYQIKSYLNTFKEKGVEVIFFNLYDYNYMDDNYTIKDETILEKIFLKYYTILFTNILNDFDNYEHKPMNESVERKEDTFNKIVDFMISDTTWYIFMEDGDGTEEVRVEITFPSGDADEFPMDEMEVEWDQFYWNGTDKDYLEEQFGITERWITQELYNRYINKLRHIIYEEMINYNK